MHGGSLLARCGLELESRVGLVAVEMTETWSVVVGQGFQRRRMVSFYLFHCGSIC